jgi:hypothetical protein
MEKTEIKIDEKILQRTTSRNHDFRCLSGDKQCLCEVKGSIGADMKDIKPNPEIECKYHPSFGNNNLCLCPTRAEIYNRYRI